ncbi:MAG: hypothetical protein HGA31_03355 [Candidatus Moranbacteria bacterium]|nr:hypothetical protein [Candidatus Moranbacteria bacterium]
MENDEQIEEPVRIEIPGHVSTEEGGIRGGFGMFSRGILESDEGFTFFRNPLVISVMTVTGLLLLSSFLMVFFYLFRTDNEVIVLHYNVYSGIDIIGNPGQAFLIPGVPLLFFLINLVLARRFYASRERVAAHILLFSALFASLAGAVVSVALSFINS